MKHQLKIEWVNKDNYKELYEMINDLFPDARSFGFNEDIVLGIVNNTIHDFYPLYNIGFILYDNKRIGVTGFYNTFLFKKDVWMDWHGVYKEYSPLLKTTIDLLISYIKKYFPEVDFIRNYLERDEEDCKCYKEMGFLPSTKKWTYNNVSGIEVLGKSLKDNIEYVSWERKPIW